MSAYIEGPAKPYGLLRRTYSWMVHYSVLAVGLVSFALALCGEALMRQARIVITATPTAHPVEAEIGAHLMQLALLMVGFVASVRVRTANREQGGQVNDPNLQRAATTLPTRIHHPSMEGDRPAAGGSSAAIQPLSKVLNWPNRISRRYSRARKRIGFRGTSAGLGGALLLVGVLLFVMRSDANHPWAPWLWLAMLLVLCVTFVGVAPAENERSLIANDPAETRREPAMSRSEWLLLALIMVAAVVLRLWHLSTIPAGPYTDEAGRALEAYNINHGLPFNHGQFAFFGTGWWGVPSLYFWSVAQSLKLFGDDLLGARMIHAWAGILTVFYTYRIGRVAWSPRAGLIAGALIAASDFAIQFSRTAGESTTTLLAWTVCFYYLYKGLKSLRPLDFVLSGIAGGLTLYGYASGKLLPIFMLVVALYLLVRWGKKGVKLYLPRLALLALAAGLTFAPNAYFIAAYKPGALTERSSGVSIFAPQNRQALIDKYGTDNPAVVLPGQFALTYSAFDVGKEKGPFYPTDQPILPIPWAALWLLGTAYLLWRVGDARFGVLGIWLLGGLAGAALTNDTPTLQRVVGMVPTLALIPALFLDRLAGGTLAALQSGMRSYLPQRARLIKSRGRWATNIAVALLVLLVTSQAVRFYFGPYTAAAHYSEFTLAGYYAGSLDPKHDLVYQAQLTMLNNDPSTNFFLARNVPLNDMENAGDTLPIADVTGKNVHYILAQSSEKYIPILQDLYPRGAITQTNARDGSSLFKIDRISSADIDAQRHSKARYGPAAGPLLERSEPRMGTLSADTDSEQAVPPAQLTYPTTAEWTGGLIAPAYGTYRMSLTASPGASLDIDGRPIITGTTASGLGTETKVVLAKGLHTARLRGTLASAQSKVELRWGTDNSDMIPVDRRFLWGGPQGTLLSDVYANALDESWFTGPQFDPGVTPMLSRRDSVFSWRDINKALGSSPTAFAIWRGTLNITTGGDHTFDVPGAGRVTLWLDGKIVGVRGVGTNLPQLPTTAPLAQGEHQVELRFGTSPDGGSLDLFWQRPGGHPELLPPSALTSPSGGAWLATERPGVSSPPGSIR